MRSSQYDLVTRAVYEATYLKSHYEFNRVVKEHGDGLDVTFQ